MQNVKFTYGSTSGVISWDGARAEAPILLDGTPTGYETADARHNIEQAICLVLTKEFGDEVGKNDFSFRVD